MKIDLQAYLYIYLELSTQAHSMCFNQAQVNKLTNIMKIQLCLILTNLLTQQPHHQSLLF